MSKLKKYLLVFLASIGGLTVALVALLIWGGKKITGPSDGQPDKIYDNAVLTLHIGDTDLSEQGGSPRIAQLLGNEGAISVRSILRAIYEAAEDERIKGILIHVTGSEIGLAKTQEIRDALEKFKLEDKFVIAYADTFGELSNGTKGYYLASAANEIWMQPSGYVCLTGLRVEVPFLKPLFDEQRIAPQLARRGQYKSMTETFTGTTFSPAYRQALQHVTDDLLEQMVSGISASRDMDKQKVRVLIDNGPYTDKMALKKGLVDRLAYRDEVKASIRKRIDERTYFYSIKGYLERMEQEKQSHHKLGVIYVDGVISRDYDEGQELFQDYEVDGATIAKAIRQAVKEESVKAIILRINSGGGSPVASETIWHEVERAKKAGKPVVVSMSDFAASGGYLIACNATKIVAHPATLTGSIGVFGGKIVTRGAWQKYGVNWDGIQSGQNAGMWSNRTPYTQFEWKKLQSWLDNVYKVFIDKVTKGRNLSSKKVQILAKGRVWTGAHALASGLVDALGGMDKAIDIARAEASLKPEQTVTLVDFPKQKTLGERVLDSIREGNVDLVEGSKPNTVKMFRKVSDMVYMLKGLLAPAVLEQPRLIFK